MFTLPTGNEDLNRFIFTPNKDPAHTILNGLSLSQKYFKEVIALSLTCISSKNIIVFSGSITTFLIISIFSIIESGLIVYLNMLAISYSLSKLKYK